MHPKIVAPASLIPSFHKYMYKYISKIRNPQSSRLDTDKETLLAPPRLHPSALQDRIRARDPDALRRRGALQAEQARFAKLGSSRFEGVADGEEHAAAHEEWGFTYVARG